MVNEEVQKHEAVEQSDKFLAWLKDHNACEPALKWLEGRTARQAWDECERADWLLWWATAAGVGHKDLVYVACQCARRALRFVQEGELRPIRAIETAEAWCEGKATIAEVRKAAAAAYAAADAANASYAAYAAYAAADAANAAYATDAYSSAYSSEAAYADADDAYDDVDDSHAVAASIAEDIAMCAIVHQYIPFEAVWHG